MHALLSPSSSGIWSVCTPSARAAQHAPDGRSVYADRGTFCHAMTEHCLRTGQNTEHLCGVSSWESSEFFTEDTREAAQDCVDFGRGRLAEACHAATHYARYIETSVSIANWVPESFGTADLSFVADNVLEVIDWKFGEGVRVNAEENSQLRLYGLGTYDFVRHLFENIDTVRLTVKQPFLDHVSTEILALSDLLAWGEWISGRAKLAHAGEGEFIAGDHCTFCRIRATCRKRAEWHIKTAQEDFKEPSQLDLSEIGNLLPQLDDMIAWASDVKEHALVLATSGTSIPGHKLVEGRSNRRYADEPQVMKVLRGAGYTDMAILNVKLKGVTEMEKAIGRKPFQQLVGSLLDKPRGKPVLALLSDKRQEITSIESAFSDFSGDV